MTTKLQFRHIFGSHMVLQRQKNIHFHGFGIAGKNIIIKFAGQEKKTVIALNGHWEAIFPAMEAGGPYTASVEYEDATQKQVLEDILVGEVWFCSGQSNMEMPIYCKDNLFFQITDPEKEMAIADNPNIRINNASFPQRLSPEAPIEDCTGSEWVLCTGETIRNLSACAYFFGKTLNHDLNIPIGIIVAAWGGTLIEAWLPAEEYGKYSDGTPAFTEEECIDMWNKQMAAPDAKEFSDWIKWFESHGTDGMPDCTGIDYDDSSWKPLPFNISIAIPFTGRAAVRVKVNIPESLAGKSGIIRILGVNDTDRTYCNGQFIGEIRTNAPVYWNAERRYPIAAGLLKPGTNVITCVVDNHRWVGGFYNRITFFSNGEEFDLEITDLRMKPLFIIPEDAPLRPEPTEGLLQVHTSNSPNIPTTLFNAFTYAWTFYPVRGFAWYQGCSNNGQFIYYQYMKSLIYSMRTYWKDPELLFLTVQLTAFNQHHPEIRSTEEEIENLPILEYPPYAITREIETEVSRNDTNAATICIFDCGDHSDIHPRDKETVGKRMALKAESMLGLTDKLADGPAFQKMIRSQSGARIIFSNVGTGLRTTDGLPPKGFVYGDRNGNLKKAVAVIDTPNSIKITGENPLVPIERVRYAFCGFCNVNLVNSEGLPAVPFRTDKVNYDLILN